MTSITVSPEKKSFPTTLAVGLLGAGLLVAAGVGIVSLRSGSSDATDREITAAAAIVEHEALIDQAFAANAAGPSVVEMVRSAIDEHSAAFPIEASYTSWAPETVEEALAAHDAAIEAVLDRSVAVTVTGSSVADVVARAIDEHSAAFPVEASYAASTPESVEHALAMHEALIEGWLSSGA